MSTRWVRYGIVVCMLAGGAAAFADDLADAEKSIIAAWEKHKSGSATVKVTSHMEMGGFVMDMLGEGKLEYLRDGDKTRSRLEVKMTLTQKMGEQENTVESPMTAVSDGEHTYTLTEQMGTKQATKTKADPRNSGDPRQMFKQFREDGAVSLMPAQEIDKVKTFVIEFKPKESSTPAGKTQVMYSQETGVLVRMVIFGPDDAPVMTGDFTDYKFDIKFPEDHFKFVAPEGVTVTDMTGNP